MHYIYLLLIISFSAYSSLSAASELLEEDCTPFLYCQGYVNVSLPSNDCRIVLDRDWLVASNWSSCGITPSITLSSYGPYGPGSYVIRVDAWVGANRSSCYSNVVVEDKVDPVPTCEDKVIYTNNPNVITVDDDGFNATDNCTVVNDLTTYVVPEGYGTTNYDYIAYDAAGNTGSCTGKLIIRPYNDAYCLVDGNDAYEYIQRVRVNGRTSLDNNSGSDDGYGYYLNHSANLYIGETTTISLSPGFSGSSYREYWRVYIDINDDNNFSSSELVYQASGYGNLYGSFNTPGTISNIGNHRMRVIMSYGGYSDPCSSSIYGEVEDYMVHIGYYISYPWWMFRDGENQEQPLSAAQPELLTDEINYQTGPAVDQARKETIARNPSNSNPNSTLPVIYPNPLRLGTNPIVDLPNHHGVVSLHLSNALGQQVLQQRVNLPDAHQEELKISHHNVEAGLYLIRGMNENGQVLWTQRILLQ